MYSPFDRENLPENRRKRAICFTAFLGTLRFPYNSALEKLFDCDTCSIIGEDREQRLDAVVMDVAAVGILKKLPKFQRLSQLIPPIENSSRLQFSLCTYQAQIFIDNMLSKGEMKASMGKDVSVSTPLLVNQVELKIPSMFFDNKNCLEKDHIHYPRVYAVVK